MRYLIILYVIFISCISCRKELPESGSENGSATSISSNSNEVVDEGYAAPPLRLLMRMQEGPDRPYTLIEYVNIQRSYADVSRNSANYRRSTSLPPGQYGGGGSAATGFPDKILVDVPWYYETNPEVDIAKMIDCFNSIPDQGSTCSIEILVDLPVNEFPRMLLDPKQTYAGHCFLQIKKSNQGKSMIQNIGFYPIDPIRSLIAFSPIPARYVNDNLHAYNASLVTSINYSQLHTILKVIADHKKKNTKYDLTEFNCTDFALLVFNSVRDKDPLIPPKYIIPSISKTRYSNIPQGVYFELLQRIKKSESDRRNIKIAKQNSYTGLSSSPCN